jgi:hypothetical protein
MWRALVALVLCEMVPDAMNDNYREQDGAEYENQGFHVVRESLLTAFEPPETFGITDLPATFSFVV